ncbi:60Kd inner membrane protein-domain-containing protein [Cantharellus anzutake]|uniref:60Kd inner membrane protein-domain-containing protein n=1 Tax=Cantharellus anzutake TaxID=1750568 RepID=UPI0019073784|nr:60Kd inner membrane protein-domain-containing protein [Cantharellus anzutake]XP_038915332.1 60Kd inner membrane protein-domain-containing protein [Cantharellus anzutake]KAF8322783.1 60Kd inner membrane protein-domain-containing protein [Cantharellus anzutake]KAF8330153.1 60Kd inner membrane protein-domain-containing protein [Cantharellus anzutake]
MTETIIPADPIATASPIDQVVLPPALYTGDHIGDLANLGLVHWTPVGAIEALLEQLHVNLGLPWWAAIVTLSILGRAIIAPVLIRSQVNNVRLAKIKPELEIIMKKLQDAKVKDDKLAMHKHSLAARQLFAENDCSPFRSLAAPFVQLPIALSCFLAIRTMGELPLESFKTGGALWFTNLTVPDPFYILPLVSTVSIYGMMDVNAQDSAQTETTGHITNLFKALTILSSGIMVFFPSSILLFIVTNGALIVGQFFIFRIPSVRTRYGLPPVGRRGLMDRKPTPSFMDSIHFMRRRFREELAKRELEYQRQVQLKSQLSAQSLNSAQPRAKKVDPVRK